MDNLIIKLYQSPKNIFTTKDLSLIWQETNSNNLKSKIAYYVNRGALTRLSRGIFTKEKNYDVLELATNIYIPAYISFETVLREAGIIFQHYETTFVAGSLSKSITVNNHQITFRKLKAALLYNPCGIINKSQYSVATPERAFLDTIYLFPKFYFDNLKLINWEKCFEMVNIYQNQELIKRLKEYNKNYA